MHNTAQMEFPKPSHQGPSLQTPTTAPSPTPVLIPNPYNARDFAYENGYLTCLSGESWLGVDVSEYQGNINWENVAQATREAGCEWIFVEQDRTPGCAFESLKTSIDFINKLGVRF